MTLALASTACANRGVPESGMAQRPVAKQMFAAKKDVPAPLFNPAPPATSEDATPATAKNSDPQFSATPVSTARTRALEKNFQIAPVATIKNEAAGEKDAPAENVPVADREKTAPPQTQPTAAPGVAASDAKIPVRRVAPTPGKFSQPSQLPDLLADDASRDSLILAIEKTLPFIRRKDPDAPVILGDLKLTYRDLTDSLQAFLDLLQQKLPLEEFSRKVREQFDFYAAGDPKTGKVKFTGYYTPVIKASRFQTRGYNYPLYYLPENMLKVERLENEGSSEAASRVYHTAYQARNFTRGEIDGGKALADRNLEIAWLQSEMDRYFLHIQGSGILSYPNGTTEMVQFMGSNGYTYSSVGRLMIRTGAIDTGQGSMQGIKNYFRNYPQDVPKYLFKNKRYIFFRLTNELPRGSSGAEVVGHRAIATDKKIYPPGGLVFMTAKKPVLDANNKITRWEDFSRFVLDVDTGDAIRGPARADLYFGVGDRAGAGAGHYMVHGAMFYLIKKPATRRGGS